MVIEIIRYNITAGQESAFEAAYAKAGCYLEESSHCLGYQLTRCVEEPTRYILRIEWDSLDGHIDGFRRSPDFPKFFAPIRPYLASIEEMQHYEETPVSSKS